MYRRARVLLVSAGAVFAVVAATAAAEQEPINLQLALNADRTSYVLGEPVNLEVTLVNTSNAPALIPEAADVWTGHLEVLIAFGDSGYREYRGPGWGLRDVFSSGSIALRRGEARTTQATILYNRGVQTDHLNDRSAKEIRERFLEPGYALAAPGRYRIKARFYDQGFVKSVESAPIEITVDEPAGADREVWAVLKTDPDYGYFIQSGGPRGHPAEARNVEMMETLETLASEQPLSRYSEAIRRSLGKHRAVIEELRARGSIEH